MTERARQWLRDWSGLIGAVGLALAMGWLAQQADNRYVQKEYYKVDQERIGKQLDDIQSDIKTLLRRP